HVTEYPLERLAANPSLTRLTHLLLQPHALSPDDEEAYIRLPQVRAIMRSKNLPSLTHLQVRQTDMGDAGCQEIVNSGILSRLKMLDLQSGCITDAGARILADCPEMKNLELLNLNRNQLTAVGTRALKATKVKFTANRQHEGRDPEDPDEDFL